jgi:hypothetical protein
LGELKRSLAGVIFAGCYQLIALADCGSIGSTGTANGQFNGPAGISIDSGGNAWVVDYNNCHVPKFSSSGSWLQNISAPSPTGISISGSR